MRLVLLVALSLAFTGVTIAVAAPTAAACTPPNCPGWGGCRLTYHYEYFLSDGPGVPVPELECYY